MHLRIHSSEDMFISVPETANSMLFRHTPLIHTSHTTTTVEEHCIYGRAAFSFYIFSNIFQFSWGKESTGSDPRAISRMRKPERVEQANNNSILSIFFFNVNDIREPNRRFLSTFSLHPSHLSIHPLGSKSLF